MSNFISACKHYHSTSSRTPIFSPVLAFLTVGSLVPLIFSTVMAYCITGYVRDELYHNSIKSCVGGACTKVVSDRHGSFTSLYNSFNGTSFIPRLSGAVPPPPGPGYEAIVKLERPNSQPFVILGGNFR